MKKNLLLFILCIFSIQGLLGQAPAWTWAKGIGGTGNDYGTSITSDIYGNTYTTGIFEGTADFDPGPGVYSLTSVGLQDIFICKTDAMGNFVWAKAIGGVNNDVGYSISLDHFGNLYTTGYFSGTVDFNPNSGTFNLTAVGNKDCFICKLDTSGNFI